MAQSELKLSKAIILSVMNFCFPFKTQIKEVFILHGNVLFLKLKQSW